MTANGANTTYMATDPAPPVRGFFPLFEHRQTRLLPLFVFLSQGLCRVLELMVVGDSNGRPVAVPVVLILALVERVQRMASSSSSSAVKGHGPQVSKRGKSRERGRPRSS